MSAFWKTVFAKHSGSAERPSKSAPSPKSHLERWLVVGLGNPGAELEHTRHNAGFLVVDAMTTEWKMQKKVQALVAQRDGNIFAKPQTFMNRSGEGVRALADWFDVSPERVIVVHDDADLPFGEVRTKFGGGTAGHKGLKSIIAHLGTEEFWRVRVGIGRPQNPHAPLDRYVLERWTPEQSAELSHVMEHARAEVARIMSEHQAPLQKSHMASQG